MAGIIEVSNSAYEARDAALQELTILQNQAEKEQSAFESEWRELGRLIDEDKKMKEIMKIKDMKSSAKHDGSDGLGKKKQVRLFLPFPFLSFAAAATTVRAASTRTPMQACVRC